MDTNGYTPEEPIAAVATALAPAALGIIRTSGKNCIELVSRLFSRPRALLEAPGNTLVYGWIETPGFQTNGGKRNRIDEVVAGVYRAPKSFTGEDMVEISCHGGTAVVSALYNLFLANGFRPAQKGEFTFRAYINGKTDLTKAEAVREIIDSRTDVSRGRAAGRLAGDLFDEINSIKKMIVDTLAAVEVEIEYPEDEETIADAFDHTKLEQAASALSTLADSWKSEKLYQDGVRVVLCGKTNAGKSSLFNAILKEDRAIVSEIAGTTRDWLECWAGFDGIPVRLFDTAGLRETDDIIERNGVERTRDLSKDADILLYLVDPMTGLDAEDTGFLLSCNVPVLLVWSKCDRFTPAMHSVLPSDIQQKIALLKGSVCVSAKTGYGLKQLADMVKQQLVSSDAPEREQAGLGSARQEAAVREALDCVRHALKSAEGDFTLDATVQDLEDALDCLGEVTGDVTPDDILDSIFSHFCVGK